jgi:hypothetical protein
MTKHLPLALALFAAASSVLACTAAEPAARSTSAASEKMAAGSMKRAPMKANSTGLVLRYAAPDTLKAGQATPLRIELSGASSDDARVELRPSSPDIVVTQDGHALQGPIALARGATRTIDLLVTAPADGAHHLTVVMSQGGRVAVSALPLKVGTAAVSRKTEGRVEVTPSGERVISMPAK